jgi:hypothetical protein
VHVQTKVFFSERFERHFLYKINGQCGVYYAQTITAVERSTLSSSYLRKLQEMPSRQTGISGHTSDIRNAVDEIATAGNGQFRTPRHIIKLMANCSPELGRLSETRHAARRTLSCLSIHSAIWSNKKTPASIAR